jgi:7-cyano-7-deazaguanine synthase
MEKSIVLLSGGMDSALTLAIAKQSFEVAALHINYGQITEDKELWAFNKLCDYYEVAQRLIVDIKYLTQIGGSSLTDKTISINDANLSNQDIPNTYVPFRNANILAIATSWAEVIGAKGIFIGANQLDSSGYPDTRLNFFEAFEKMIDYGTKPETKIRIYTPIINMTKKEIVQTATNLNVPLEYTWSCYRNNDIACGTCDSCALRLRGFEEANLTDPIDYLIRPNYL